MKQLLCILVLLLTASGVSAEPVYIDVRSESEYQSGHIDGHTNIPHTEIVSGVDAMGLDKESEIVLYCRSGGRAGMAQAALMEQGYSNVVNAGGMNDVRTQLGEN